MAVEETEAGTMRRASTEAMTHADWMGAASVEYDRIRALLGTLESGEWEAPTDCEGWDVHAIVSHLAGAACSTARVRELLRQARRGRRILPDVDLVDAMNALQVQERADRDPEELLDELARVAPRAVRARARIPRPLRALPIRFGPPLGTQPLGYLTDRIYTRDAWLHRIDVCRAVGREPQLTAAHDGRIVADVVAEWAQLHGQPYELRLGGPAGGQWRHGTGGEEIEVDAVQLCRILSGRATGTGLLATRVNF